MPAIPSAMKALSSKCPDFSLTEVTSQKQISRDKLIHGKQGLLVMFICAHCPYVVHIQKQIAQLGKEYQDQPLSIVAISSNDAEQYPDDAPEKLAKQAKDHGFVFPYLYDESQEVAKAFEAACTPDFFLYDRNLQLVYRGQFDNSRPSNNEPVTGEDLCNAIDALLANQPPVEKQHPSLGCSIKWRE